MSDAQNRPWEQHFIDPLSRYLSDEEAELLYQQHPHVPRSYLDGCPTCGGTGAYVDVDHKEYECNCEIQLQLHKLYLRAGIGDIYQRLTWDDYDLTSQAVAPLKTATQYLDSYHNYVLNGIGIMYIGEFGAGKTMLSCLTAKALIRLGYDAFFTTFQGMAQMFTAGWKSQSDKALFEQRVVGSQVLVLDDIGKEFRTKTNMNEALFDHVLRQRVINARPTFLTANENQDSLRHGYGSAVISLISERSIVQTVEGTDFRPKARDRAVLEAQQGIRRPIV